MKNKKYICIILFMVLLVIIDQIIKIYINNNLFNTSIIAIKNVFNITYTQNTGGAYGIGGNSTVLFIISTVIIIGLIIYFLIANKDKIKQSMFVSLILIISGGLGNLIDRIVRGFVIDYIDISPIIKFPVFNLADICITIGVIFLGISIIKDSSFIEETNKNGKN